MLSGIPDGSLPDTLTSIVKASYLEKLEVQIMIIAVIIYIFFVNSVSLLKIHLR